MEIARTRTDEDLTLEHLRVPAGNAATHYAFATGTTDLGDNSPSLAPPAPGHGLRCEDHSGGEYGRPLFRTIYTHASGLGQEYNSGALSRQSLAARFFEGGVTDGERSTASGFNFAPFLVYVPGCDKIHGAYAHLGIIAVVYVDTLNTLVSGDELKLHIANLTAGSSVVFDVDETGSGAEGFFSDASNTPSELLSTVPGRPNLCRAWLELYAAGTGGTRVVDVILTELEFGVYEV